jgi:hypothetical protein
MASYSSLADPVTNHDDAYYSAVVCTKFCAMGMVVSMTWTATYINVMDGVLRLYDSKETFNQDPTDHVLEICLAKGHYSSPIRKVFIDQSDVMHQESGAEFYGFYLMKDYGIMMPLRELKICCAREDTAERLARVIDSNAN